MFSRALLVSLVVGVVGLTVTGAAVAATPAKADKVTITGIAKRLVELNAKMDPLAANATLTVTTKDDAGKEIQVVYYVYGSAGVLLAKTGDGKKAEVAGVVFEKDGNQAITAKSADVKILAGEARPAKP